MVWGLFKLLSADLLPPGFWDLSSLTRDRTHVPCIARQILFFLEGGFLTTGPPGKFPLLLTFISTEESVGNWGEERQRIKQGWVYESPL